METECKRVILFLFLSLLFCNGFAQTKHRLGPMNLSNRILIGTSEQSMLLPFYLVILLHFRQIKLISGLSLGDLQAIRSIRG